MSKAKKALAVLAATMLAAGGCTDTPTSPSAPVSVGAAPQQKLLGELLGAVTGLLVPPVKRNTPLASDVTWSLVAGPDGAVSKNSSVGLTVSIPAGALSTTTTITVRALAGSAVAYSFDTAVTLTQSLSGTSAGGLLSLPLVSGAHFDGERLSLTSGGLAIVNEVVPALANIFTRTASFQVDHFSGWILASGRCSDAN